MEDQDLCAVSVDGIHGVIAEAWGEGFMVGSIVILIFFVISNMRRKVWLHRLIILELVLASFHGTFIFTSCPINSWYTSTTALLLYLSYNMHNIVNWVKISPFLPRWGVRLYLYTLILACPFWVSQIYLNFAYYNDLGNRHFRQTRPWEALLREPWWIFTNFYLVYIIKRCYNFEIVQLFCLSPRFCMLTVAVILSIGFIIADIVETAISFYGGRNPFWKLALVFKCTADALFLDDFKAVLDRLSAHCMRNIGDDIETPRAGRSEPTFAAPTWHGSA